MKLFEKLLYAVLNFLNYFHPLQKDTAERSTENLSSCEEECMDIVAADRKAVKNDFHQKVRDFLFLKYDFRYNVLTEQVEYCVKSSGDARYRLLNHRMLNTMVIEARGQGLNCWDKDVERLLKSNFVHDFHPFYDYMERLPKWDGVDRVTPLAMRVDRQPLWVNGFKTWLLALTAQWMGQTNLCANSLTPILISTKQGMRKSTFCRLLMPEELRPYYLDKLDLNAKANVEMKLGQFGLINLDEFDRYSNAAMATLKNLLQLKELTVKKSYASYFIQLGRIASFIGTSNRLELLNDPSGSRRFLCVEVLQPIDVSPIDHAQLFAQLKAQVVGGERVWMDANEEQTLQQHNLLFAQFHPEEEVFMRLFDIPKQNEEGQMMTTTEIHHLLCQNSPSSMRGVNASHLGRTLSGLGLKRIHTKTGNKYFVRMKRSAL